MLTLTIIFLQSPGRVLITPEPPNIQRRLKAIEEKQDLVLKAIGNIQKEPKANPAKGTKKGMLEVPNSIRVQLF